ncbi:MAG: glycosyltransferase, partial [Candidatus Hadarchaeum sp.]
MNLLMLINTAGLDYDDRLRKEVLSLQELGIQVQVVALEYKNLAGEQIIYGHTSALTIHLCSRSWFPRSRGLLVKTIEMYWRFFVQILKRKPQMLWVHNLEVFGLMPVLIAMRKAGIVKRLIWDQHELPSDSLLANRAYMSLYCMLVNGCDVVVMANKERRDLILRKVKITSPVYVLYNYPDRVFHRLPKKALPQMVLDWLQNMPYVLAQGGANPDRHLRELVNAIMQQSDVKLIVVGPYHESQLDEFNREYGEEWRSKILFTGFVPQLDITPYIDHAIASVVFYAMKSENSRLCAPNRLYQALSRGVPVIVGPNPPMRQLVEKTKCGIVVEHDDPRSILQGIQEIRS